MAPAKNLAEAASHEVGHNLSLHHDGRTPPPEDYYYGHGAWAPIMGVGYDRPVTQWSKGEYANANEPEDDLALITANGLPVLGDDHGNVNAAATVLIGSPPQLSATGLISTRTDVDVFSFTAPGGQLVTIDADPAAVSPNLDISLELFDAGGSPVASADVASAYCTADVATGLDATIQQVLAAGTYYARIDGVGQGTASTGYTDYASVGQYDITATFGVCALGDPGEEDDGSSSARLLVPGQAASGTRCAGDDDWLRVPSLNGTTLTADLSIVDDDLTLELLDAAGTALTSAAATVGTPAHLVWPVTANADHFLRIAGGATVESRYNLTTSLGACPPDDQWENDDYINQTTALTVPGLKDGLSCSGDTNNADHAQVTLQADVETTIQLHYPQSAGAVGMYLFRWPESGSSVASGVQGVDVKTITYTPTVTDQYQIRVDWQSGAVPYHLVVSQGAPANLAPTVALTAPAQGATVSGLVSLAATATDDISVASVTFYVDGVQVGVDTTSGDGWTNTWDSAAYADGNSHTVTATAVDGLGQKSFDSRTVIVPLPCPCAASPDVTYNGNVPARAVDGDPTTWWQPSGTAGSKTIEVSLPAPVALSTIRAQFYSSDFRFSDYTIQTWNGASWDTAATVVGNTLADNTTPPTGATTDRFRLVATAWNSPSPYYGPAIRELTWTTGTCPCAASPDVVHNGNVPGRAVDGDPATWWQPSGTAGSKTIEVVLPTPVALSSIRAQFYSSDFRFTDYTIETWNGASWDTAATVVGNTTADLTTPLTGATSDRFRLVATTWNSPSPYYGPAVRELTWTT